MLQNTLKTYFIFNEYPNLGIYRTFSAATKPTGRKILEAGIKGRIRKSSEKTMALLFLCVNIIYLYL